MYFQVKDQYMLPFSPTVIRSGQKIHWLLTFCFWFFAHVQSANYELSWKKNKRFSRNRSPNKTNELKNLKQPTILGRNCSHPKQQKNNRSLACVPCFFVRFLLVLSSSTSFPSRKERPVRAFAGRLAFISTENGEVGSNWWESMIIITISKIMINVD